MDMIRWCLGKDAPRAVTAMGGKYAVKDNREIPDTLEVLWEFDGPRWWCSRSTTPTRAAATSADSEMELRGTKGTMYIHERPLGGGAGEGQPEPGHHARATIRSTARASGAYGADTKPAIEAQGRERQR